MIAENRYTQYTMRTAQSCRCVGLVQCVRMQKGPLNYKASKHHFEALLGNIKHKCLLKRYIFIRKWEMLVCGALTQSHVQDKAHRGSRLHGRTFSISLAL